jgi:hypothetical protein
LIYLASITVTSALIAVPGHWVSDKVVSGTLFSASPSKQIEATLARGAVVGA